MLSTNSWMGGKNLFLGVAYLVVGGLSFLTALSFLVAHYTGCFGVLRRRKCASRSAAVRMPFCLPLGHRPTAVSALLSRQQVD